MGNDEELLEVGDGLGDQPYYDSFVRNKLPKRPAEEANPRPATICGSSAQRLQTGSGLSVKSDSDLLLSRSQLLAKDKHVAFASDLISATGESCDTNLQSVVKIRAMRGSGSDLQYSATI